MVATDAKLFSKMIKLLREAFPDGQFAITPQVIELYYRPLKPFTIAQIQRGLDYLTQERTLTNFPSIAEVKRAIEAQIGISIEIDAGTAFDETMNHGLIPPTGDHTAYVTFNSMKQRLRRSQERDIEYLRKEWIRLYQKNNLLIANYDRDPHARQALHKLGYHPKPEIENNNKSTSKSRSSKPPSPTASNYVRYCERLMEKYPPLEGSDRAKMRNDIRRLKMRCKFGSEAEQRGQLVQMRLKATEKHGKEWYKSMSLEDALK